MRFKIRITKNGTERLLELYAEEISPREIFIQLSVIPQKTQLFLCGTERKDENA